MVLLLHQNLSNLLGQCKLAEILALPYSGSIVTCNPGDDDEDSSQPNVLRLSRVCAKHGCGLISHRDADRVPALVLEQFPTVEHWMAATSQIHRNWSAEIGGDPIKQFAHVPAFVGQFIKIDCERNTDALPVNRRSRSDNILLSASHTPASV